MQSLVGDTIDSVFQEFNIEVHKEANSFSTELEVAEYLSFVNRYHLIDGFKFNYHQVFN